MTDDPYPRNAALADLVTRARAVPTPRVNVTAQEVSQTAGASARSRWPLAVGFAAAAALLIAFAMRSPDKTQPSQDPTPVTTRDAPMRSPAVAKPDSEPPGVTQPPPEAPGADVPAPDLEPARTRLAGLAEGVTVETVEGPTAVIAGPWRVDVAGGVYKISLEPEVASSVSVRHADRTLQVEPGATVWLRDGELELEAGKARWNDASVAPVPTASALAATAEKAMAAGDRTAAVRALTTLVRKHPRAAETRTGLVDLARLRAAAGDPDRARCAYNLALKRWPNAAIATDIERALARLGDGPKCRGLTPR